MKPLICPQCGGKITEYDQWQKFATCQYCSTRFLIEQEIKPPAPVHFESSYNSSEKLNYGQNLVIGIVVVVGLVFGVIILLSVVKTKPKPTSPNYPVYTTTTPQKTASPTPTPNPNLLEFGGKGTGNGLFQDADAIAVDKQGRIYVADDSLRVQQFNEKGEFLKVWQIPSQTIHYKRARSIQKIAVDDKNRLHVLVGGTILVYEPDASEPFNTFHAAPDFMVDFALRSDGTMLIVSSNDEIETLIYVNKAGKVTRRINGFHTETADAVLSPRETGLAAIRLGVDGAGNIYSVYAFGDLGGYELNYDAEDLMIFRFTPEAKYVNKFVQTMNSCGIDLDNQSRIYISDESSINIYTNSGEPVSTVPDLGGIDAFALDKENNIYVLADDKVIKRSAVK
jgi:sugar lactone lactonase YvrE/DNA-directed RNA polymerase subunit RPC12/RpoP